MTTVLAIVEKVGLATVQDAGRFGLQHVGVPVAGAWHRRRYGLACALLSGDAEQSLPAIEILDGELLLRTLADATVVITGPAMARSQGRSVATGSVVWIAGGADLSVVPSGRGPVYLAVAGWTPDRVLGSSSVDTFSRLGGEPLRTGDVLTGDPSKDGQQRVGWFHRHDPDPAGPIRIVLADPHAGRDFVERRWQVRQVARSGVRLSSAGWMAPRDSMASFPVVTGAIQATPDGSAIVLGPDGGLTGGYPVVGVVASADLDRMSLAAPGTELTFASVDVRTAVRLWHESDRRAAHLLAHPAQLA